jgi:hypothetical protein
MRMRIVRARGSSNRGAQVLRMSPVVEDKYDVHFVMVGKTRTNLDETAEGEFLLLPPWRRVRHRQASIVSLRDIRKGQHRQFITPRINLGLSNPLPLPLQHVSFLVQLRQGRYPPGRGL